MAHDNMITQRAILARDGWSRLLVKKLGEPDKQVSMPGHKNPANLFHVVRVELFEQSPTFLEYQDRLMTKRKAALQSHAQKAHRRLGR